MCVFMLWTASELMMLCDMVVNDGRDKMNKTRVNDDDIFELSDCNVSRRREVSFSLDLISQTEAIHWHRFSLFKAIKFFN